MAFQGFLKQSTAVDVLLGPFLDDTDGKTAEAGLTITQADVKLSKNGQALAQKNDANACAADGADGYYNGPLDATDTNTVGQLTVIVHESGALPIRLDYHVVEEAVYNAMYGSSAAGPLQSTTAARKLDVNAAGEAGLDLDNTSGTIDAAQLGADCITAAKIADDAFVAANFATGCLTADAFAADALVAATFATSSLDGKGNWNTVVPDAAGVVATALGALETHGDSTWSTATSVTVSDKTGFSLVSTGLDAVTAWTVAITGNITGNLSGSVGSVTTKTGYSLAAAGADLILKDSTFALAIADAVWDELLAGHTTADTAGLVLNEWQDGGRLDLLIDAIKAKTDGLNFDGNNVLADVMTMDANVVSAQAVSSDVINTILDGVWDELTTNHVGAGSFVAQVKTLLDYMYTYTNTLYTDWVNDGRLDLLIDSIKAKTDNLPASPAAVGSAMTLTADERNAVGNALLALAEIDGKTVQQALRYIAAGVAGELSGAGTGTETAKGLDGATTRVVATVDVSGNRTPMSYDPA